MIKFDLTERFSFHDSGLTNIVNYNNNIIFYVEDVDVNDFRYSMKISIKNVEKITENGVIIDSLTMQTDHGSIFDFQEEESVIMLCINWRRYSPTWSKFCVYKFKGANISAEVYDSKPTE